MSVDTKGRTGRRPGPVSTRDSILDAAREQFTQHGFKGATLRAIAGQAGVDPGLIRHFFGDKEGLFVASLELPREALDAVRGSAEGPPEQWGERLTRGYLSLWEDPETAAPLRALVVSAFANELALTQLRDFLTRSVLADMAPLLPQDQPGLRLASAMTHLVGTALGRYLLRIPPMVEPSLDEIVALVSPAVQGYLTGPLPESLASGWVKTTVP